MVRRKSANAGPRLKELLQASQGQALVEYAFILLFVALVCFIALGDIGARLIDMFVAVENAFP